jgi:hypothetical protein
MKNVNTLERTSSISEIYQFLQTIHKKLLSNNQVSDKSDEKRTFVRVKQCLSKNLRETEETNH